MRSELDAATIAEGRRLLEAVFKEPQDVQNYWAEKALMRFLASNAAALLDAAERVQTLEARVKELESRLGYSE